MHRYPLIGRFANVTRKRAYLWSFKSEYVRPALYAGAIIALLPVIGLQMLVAFLAALLLRANVMVLAGLQVISNPLSALPLYYGTYKLGQAVINASGFGCSVEIDPSTDPTAVLVVEPVFTLSPAEWTWTQGFGTAINSCIIGGVIAGAILGLILDLIWKCGVQRAFAHKTKGEQRKHDSDSTPPIPTPE
ncbi:MAG: DUF2062 domain-containing protein [Candidatus Synoicihabitans palmerolidicus]|nr:DUF2062 domain-containing protein [Candidatus Synoicihabitans palmerolidicus]